MKKVFMIIFLALISILLFGQFENSIITCSSAAVNEGDEFNITISTTELQESWNITAFQFDLDFNPAVANYTGFAAGEVVAGSGSLLANESTPGHVIVAFAHYEAISGVGNLVTLNFEAAGIGNTILDVNDFKYNATYLAAGNLIDGSVQVTEYNPFQDITITAGSGNVTVGNPVVIPISTTMLTSDMGAISFQFDIDFDPSVLSFTTFALGNVPDPGNFIANESSPGVVSVAYATVMPITGEGTLCTLTFTGEAEGTTALDLNEFKYNSTYLYNLVDGSVNVVEYNPYEEVVITAGSANAAIGNVVEIPISTTELISDMGAISFQFNLAFDNSLLTFDSFRLGEVPNPGNLIANESSPGVISVAYANVMPITGEGNLCYLSFAADAAGTSDLVLSQFKYNSTYLNYLVNGGITISAVQYPDWSVNAPDYEYSETIWGIVQLDDVEVEITTGMLGCFVDDECRGIASFADGSIIDYNEYFGHIIFLPMIFSNVTSGETIDFLYFDAETEGIYQVAESIEFEADVTVGDGYNPFIFHASTVSTIDISKAMVPGWNWFSLNVTGEDMSTNNVLASIGANASNIKSQTQSAMYYPGPGWLGSLTTINNNTFYKLGVNNPTTLEYTGTPVEVSETIYDLTSGWNWISYAPQASENINYALGSLNEGSNIKSQTQSAMYYAGPGWLGSLTTLQSLGGYMLKMNAPEQLIYPEPLAVASNPTENIPVNNFANSNKTREIPDWSINPPDYEYSFSMWGIVMMNGIEVDVTTGMLGCFVDGECRGIAQEGNNSVQYMEYFDHVLFLPEIYSNQTSGETVNFYYYNAETDEVYEVAETVEFVADVTIGDGFDPFVFTVETGGNLPPTANAGLDQEVVEGDFVTLDGSASSDPEGATLTYLWTAPAGITLDDPTAVMPTFTAPLVDMDMDYTFTLVVNDGEADSNPDEVIITVTNIWVYEESMIVIGSDDVTELDNFIIPVTTSPIAEEWSVISFQFDLSFDPEILAYVACTLGEVPNPSMLLANELEPGHLRVAYANALPISGEGTLCNLEFQAIGMGGSSDLHVWDFKYNQTYMTNLWDGLVNVEPLPNHDPEITLPDQFVFVTNETLEVDFSMYTYDPDGDELTLSVSGNTDIEIVIDEMMVEFSAPTDWTGSEIVTFLVNDNYTGRPIAFDDVEILVTLPEPVLEMDLPEALSLVTNAAVVIDFEEYITYLNIEPETLTLDVTGNDNIDVAFDGFEVTFTSTDWIGTENMTFTVSDEVQRLVASDDVMVSVVDFANSVLTLESLSVDDGTDFDIALNTSIIDITWNVISFQGKITFDTNYLTWNNVTIDNTITPAGGMILGNLIEANVISFAYMNSNNLEGEGPIAFFNFTAHGIGETTLDLWDYKYNSTYMLDENLIDGVITINDMGIQYVPIADAGIDQSVIGGDLVTLDGSGSFDMNGDDLTYAWTAPTGITLNNTAAIMPTFTAPVNTVVEEYIFSLIVTDDDGSSEADEVMITVIPPNMPPVAMAGDDVSMWENMTVTLDGSASYDPDGDPITFLWEAPGLTIDDPTAIMPVITAPDVDDDTEYTVTLTVSDGMATGSDELTITVMVVTIPLTPPSNLAVENLDGGTAMFTWDPPAEAGEWIHYDSGTNDDAIGLTNGGNFHVAARWDAGDLDDYDGLNITKINVYFQDANCTFTAKAWTGANAGTQILSQALTNPLSDSWNEVIFDTPITIDSSVELWIGYSLTGQVAGDYPAGCDAGPAVAGYGDMISTNGTTWDALSVLVPTLNYNWNIQAFVAGATRTFELPAPNHAINNNVVTSSSQDMFARSNTGSNNNSSRLTRELLGYNVYLDNVWLNEDDLVTETEYLFTGLDDGTTYEAGVVAVYDEGYSTMPTIEFTYFANLAPVADAGNDQVVRDGVAVNLNGSDSYDPDGDVITYAWTAPAGITLINPTSVTPTFIAPDVTNDTDYTITLVVSDGEYTDSDQVVVTVQHDEPGNVNAVHLANPHFVQLSWEAPGIGGETGEWMHYDSGMNDDGIGLTNGGSFAVAARWAAGDLDDYDGLQITKMTYFPLDASCSYTLKVWTGANGATEILSQPVTAPAIETWNEVYFTTPITIDSSVELWIGYAINNQVASTYPAGCDAGPAVAGYGDMISMGGGAWQAMSGLGLDYNWNIQAFVVGATAPLPAPVASEIPEITELFTQESNEIACGNLEPASTNTRDERSFLTGFHVYLDDVLYDDELLDIDETSYIFMNVYGNHSYGVAAVYNDGESDIMSVDLDPEDNNELPLVTELSGNYPNPFNPETTIKMALNTDGQVRLDVYNIRGQKVRTLVNEFKDAGNYDIIWNGDDDRGQKVGSGVYFYNMKFGKYTSTKKMILMK
ncbi:MAG: T9SS type A sorting domain-containing protein [Candidatus Cloacimonetes bacterium]|nr:T9SS type A sorting domain-containing protein [Candidatus Cloacimonadota bacterium]